MIIMFYNQPTIRDLATFGFKYCKFKRTPEMKSLYDMKGSYMKRKLLLNMEKLLGFKVQFQKNNFLYDAFSEVFMLGGWFVCTVSFYLGIYMLLLMKLFLLLLSHCSISFKSGIIIFLFIYLSFSLSLHLFFHLSFFLSTYIYLYLYHPTV